MLVLPLAIEVTDNTDAGQVIVGAGTALLALGTGYLGWHTRQNARAARRAVEASDEPFVIPPSEIRLAHDGNRHFVRMKLWNIGLGPAIVRKLTLLAVGPNSDKHPEPLISPNFQYYALEAGQSDEIEIRAAPFYWRTGGESATLRQAKLRITYTRANGVEYWTDSMCRVEGGDVVRCVSYRRARAKEKPWEEKSWPRKKLEKRKLDRRAKRLLKEFDEAPKDHVDETPPIGRYVKDEPPSDRGEDPK